MNQTIQEMIAQRAALDKKIEDAKKEHAAAAVAQVRALIAEFGLTPADLGFEKARGRKAGASAVKPKYRSPTGETWAGRGRKPRWLEEAIAAGRKVEDFAI